MIHDYDISFCQNKKDSEKKIIHNFFYPGYNPRVNTFLCKYRDFLKLTNKNYKIRFIKINKVTHKKQY